MKLGDYFEKTRGTGVLATADGEGRVDAAVYARPHVMDDGSVVFIMLGRLTHHNLQSNPHAAFLFIEDGGGYRGVRLFLEKVKEVTDPEVIDQFVKRCPVPEAERDPGPRFLVYFKLNKILELIGGESSDLTL